MPFARTLVDKLEDMKATCQGQPLLPMSVPSVLDTIGSPWPMRDSDCEWHYAGFAEVFQYLRGNKKLEIPPEFRAITPRSIG